MLLTCPQTSPSSPTVGTASHSHQFATVHVIWRDNTLMRSPVSTVEKQAASKTSHPVLPGEEKPRYKRNRQTDQRLSLPPFSFRPSLKHYHPCFKHEKPSIQSMPWTVRPSQPSLKAAPSRNRLGDYRTRRIYCAVTSHYPAAYADPRLRSRFDYAFFMPMHSVNDLSLPMPYKSSIGSCIGIFPA